MSYMRIIALSLLAFSRINSVDAQTSAPRDTWQIQLKGNTSCSADSIRTALSLDLPSQQATRNYVSDEEYSRVLGDRITRGYLASGFRDVEVSVQADDATGAITATIREGRKRVCRDIFVKGLTEREAEFVTLLIKNNSEKKNPLQEAQPALTYWKHKSKLSFVEAPEQTYGKTVKEAMAATGYPEALFSIECSELEDGDKTMVDLLITVTDTGAPLTVGDIVFTGLEQHSSELVIEFLQLKPGMPLTLELRDSIVRRLLDSARFLVAEVQHSPYFFDPTVPLDLKIHVREYDRVASLGQELTESQKALLKISQWTSQWDQSGEDVRIQYTGPTSQASSVLQATVPPELQSFCDSAMGTGTPGHFCVDAVTSPAEGSVITVSVIDAQGNVTMRRTLVLARTAQGLVSWQGRKIWMHSDLAALRATISFHGLWPNENGSRGKFFLGYSTNLEWPKGLKTEINATPAAMMDMFHDQVQTVSIQEQTTRLDLKHGQLVSNEQTGTPLAFNFQNDEIRFELTSGVGLFAQELQRIQAETKDWPNQNQPGRAWTGLASMIVEDIRTAQLDDNDMLHLSLDLLRNEAAVARFNQGLTALENRCQITIPPDRKSRAGKDPSPNFSLGIMAAATPPGSFPHRFATLTNQAKATGEGQLLQQLVGSLLLSDQHGAIDCLLVARTLGNQEISGLLANAGQSRLSTAEFERDVAPLLTQPCYVREIACTFLSWLQQTSDDDVERLVRVAALYLKDPDEKPINIRPLIALVRSHREKTPEDVLIMLPPLIWEGGLRNWVATSLHDIEEASRPSTKSYFNASSTKILNELTARPEAKESANKKPPVKTAEESGLD